MIQDKQQFIHITFPALLKSLKGNEKGEWGKMSPQQMVEHMTESIRIATEKRKFAIQTPPEKLPLLKSFMMSDKEFKPNTKNALMEEVPPAVINAGLPEAIRELEEEINYFLDYFKSEPEKTTVNPFFGVLSFEEWIQLLYKHCMHHARQFSLVK